MSDDADGRGRLAANAAFYAAFERADFDAMQAVWADDDGVVCVHPGLSRSGAAAAVIRSWVAADGRRAVHPVLPHRRRAQSSRRLATVTCRENVLSAGDETPAGAFAGGKAVATNVFRLTAHGWRLWVHHASPVLSEHGPLEEAEHHDRRLPPSTDRRTVPWDPGLAAGRRARARAARGPGVRRRRRARARHPARHRAETTSTGTVHYGGLAERLHAAVESDPVDLIETLAQRMADICLAEPPVDVGRGHRPQAPRTDPGGVRRRQPDHPSEPR